MIGAVLALFFILSIVIFFYQKRNESLDKKVKEETTAKEQSNAVIMQKVKEDGALKKVEIELRNRRKFDQQKIDAGDRSGFEDDKY